MCLKNIVKASLVAALVCGTAGRASADAGDAIAGAIVGGILGHAIAKDQQRRKTVYVRRSSSVSAAQRQINRETQTALNYFGFGAGSVDGKVGPGTRSAVSRFQAQTGYPASGYIQQHERDFLIGAYHWATSGGAAVTAARTPGELLVAYRQRMVAPQGTPVQPMAVMPAPPATTLVVTPQMATPQPAAPAAPEPAAPMEAAAEADAVPLLPNFMGAGETASLASHCNQVALLTSTNGGFTTAASMTDAAFALDEQFCLARTYAIAEGEDLASKVQGVGESAIVKQCQGFGPTMRPHVAALSLRPRDEVLRDVAAFVLETGMAPAQLAGTARICLSVGYRTDDMDVAIGSALVLVALGERVYGELMGHHLVQGIGSSKRPDLAADWYQMGLDALDGGGRAVFAPGQPERQALIAKASATIAGGSASPAAAPTPVSAALPAFSLEQ